jgi:ADP-ribosyl-[dinitrogen reductase] hydrolase
MLFEMAIGDAYGAGFEYAKPDFVKANHKLNAYVKHPKHDIAPGSYTDDTQMSIANAEVICSGSITRETLAQAYVECFKRDQREGYAGGFYKFLCEVKDGAEFLARIKPDSDKSGGAMRALPFSIYPDVETVKSMTALQAAITHNTTDGINAAVAAALMAHYFLYKLGAKSSLGKFIESHVPGTWAEPWTEPVGQQGVSSVRAAITAVMAADSMTEILRRSVDSTGDVDTVAALALGAAAASPEVKQDLPDVLVKGLENGTYGREFLRALDQRLMQTMASLQQAANTLPPVPAPALIASPPATTTASAPRTRILAVQIPEQWTGAINKQDFLEIPSTMDIAQEEQAWFGSGGDTSGKSFVEYLIAQGAVRVSVEIWNINYM